MRLAQLFMTQQLFISSAAEVDENRRQKRHFKAEIAAPDVKDYQPA